MPNTTSLVLQDNGYGTLGSSLSTSDTTLTFTSGHGTRFPAVASGQVLLCCILNANNVLEEVAITLHTAGADTATMARAQNGTTAKAWNAGDRIEARISSEALKRLQTEALKQITLSTADSGATYTGSISPTGYGYVSGLVYSLNAATSNIGTTPTINLSSLGAVTVLLNGGAAPAANQMPPNGLYLYDGSNFILLNPKDGSWSTGDVKLSLKTAADTGWVLFNDGTIGDASSGATTRANADTAALFTLLWTNTADADCAVSTGRGVSAAADYSAHKTIALPKALGRTLAVYGTGSGLTARALAHVVGEESHALSLGELPSITAALVGAGTAVNTAAGISIQNTNVGGSATAHNTMQPTVFLNVMAKL